MIYRGRDILWFSPTEEAPGQYRREDLDSLSVGVVGGKPANSTRLTQPRNLSNRSPGQMMQQPLAPLINCPQRIHHPVSSKVRGEFLSALTFPMTVLRRINRS